MRKAFGGGLILLAIQSLHQDLIGKEEYIRRINYQWIDSYYTVPFALVLLIIGFYLLDDWRRK